MVTNVMDMKALNKYFYVDHCYIALKVQLENKTIHQTIEFVFSPKFKNHRIIYNDDVKLV